MTVCSICGGRQFTSRPVLWPQLIADWQLTDEEVNYVNDQQGRSCDHCGACLRVVALGNAIRGVLQTELDIRAYCKTPEARQLRILDINGAIAISDSLAVLPGYRRANYPEVDLQKLSFENGSFDLVLHSDTLEHVEDAVLALQECKRVLAPEGRLCFTVPVLVGRLTRSRTGMAPSYHGKSTTGQHDFVVHTEFGADAWTFLMRAGFTGVSINHVEYPAATAFCAWTDSPKALRPRGRVAIHPEDRVRLLTARVRKHGGDFVRRLMRARTQLLGEPEGLYDQDGLLSVHNHDFMKEAAFASAYARGARAAGADYRWHWRVHVGLWAASCAAKLPGDFVECGVNRGFLSSAIMSLLNWDAGGRTFYLLDTFKGLDERYLSDADMAQDVMQRNADDIRSGFYTISFKEVQENFAEWKNKRLIVGSIPETLSQIESRQIAFAHIDLNCSMPEVAAADFLWERLTPGALILLDDYAYRGFESQKRGMDEFARRRGVSVLSLPTGQGLIIKPPDRVS